ncbi:hypothetical protein SLEP1_g10789 [Rubroshorea leprosula]|uniref:Uncharacterized protein n=1 Tax=Rubroshorea leprosula TaxID=152421 RepID=A0AAV5IJ73_9ROSI|nr:hypothetical protein SLEP1_g10789 [Rubroshorea leprosula]
MAELNRQNRRKDNPNKYSLSVGEGEEVERLEMRGMEVMDIMHLTSPEVLEAAEIYRPSSLSGGWFWGLKHGKWKESHIPRQKSSFFESTSKTTAKRFIKSTFPKIDLKRATDEMEQNGTSGIPRHILETANLVNGLVMEYYNCLKERNSLANRNDKLIWQKESAEQNFNDLTLELEKVKEELTSAIGIGIDPILTMFISTESFSVGIVPGGLYQQKMGLYRWKTFVSIGTSPCSVSNYFGRILTSWMKSMKKLDFKYYFTLSTTSTSLGTLTSSSSMAMDSYLSFEGKIVHPALSCSHFKVTSRRNSVVLLSHPPPPLPPKLVTTLGFFSSSKRSCNLSPHKQFPLSHQNTSAFHHQPPKYLRGCLPPPLPSSSGSDLGVPGSELAPRQLEKSSQKETANVAQLMAKGIFEDLAQKSLNGILKDYKLAKNLLNAGICLLGEGNIIAMTAALKKYQRAFIYFGKADVATFTSAVKEYSKLTDLEEWRINLFKRVEDKLRAREMELKAREMELKAREMELELKSREMESYYITGA